MGEYFNFQKEHPEIDIGLMVDTFMKCRGRRPKDLKEAYEHINGCGWCKEHLKLWEKAEKERTFISDVCFWQVGRY